MSIFKWIILTVGIALSFVGFLHSDISYANGSVKVYEKRVIGSHEIGLGTVPRSPAVGVTHFAMYVKDTATNYLFDEAEVTFTATEKHSGLKIGPKQMTNSLMDPAYYELDLNFEAEGTWAIRLTVKIESSSYEVDYQVFVRKPNPIIPILTAGVLVLFLVILGLSARAWVREYRKRK